MLFSAAGKWCASKTPSVRWGRTATGVRDDGGEVDKVVSLIIPRGRGAIHDRNAKRLREACTATDEVPRPSLVRRRGVISIKVTEGATVSVVGAVQVDDCDRIMMITDAGTFVAYPCVRISVVGRNTGGVILIRTAEDETWWVCNALLNR